MNVSKIIISNLNEADQNNRLTLYHNTSNENAIKINNEGIIAGKRLGVYGKGSEAEGSGIWCTTEKGYGYGGATITFQINENDSALTKQNNTEYILYRNVKPEEIIDIDLVVANINVKGGHIVTESYIPNLIDKFGKDKVLDVFKRNENKFVRPYNYDKLVNLINTGKKYYKGNISLTESTLLEKASIDWNNYLSDEEVSKFLSKDDKVESAEEIIYDTKGNFYNTYFKDFKNRGWSKYELTQYLADFYYNGHLNEDSYDLWTNQINQKSEPELQEYLDKLYKQLGTYNNSDSNLKSRKFDDLLNKINYVENKLGIKPKIGRILH